MRFLFSSESKRMTTLHAANGDGAGNGQITAYAKGAPEVILGCTSVLESGGRVSGRSQTQRDSGSSAKDGGQKSAARAGDCLQARRIFLPAPRAA